MKTGTAVIRIVLSLAGFYLPAFFITAIGQAPFVSDIPDQTIDEGQSFLALNLDEYVSDDDNPDDQITWSYTGNEDLNITIDPGHLATVLIPFEDWNGTETITFTATDPDTNNSSDVAIFTINPVNDPPVVAGIPDQPLYEGTPFQPVDLDDYVTDVDNAKNELEWSASGFADLSVQIDPGSHVASIIVPNEDWNGTENIVFTASDASDSDNDNAEYTLIPVNDPPVIGNIPDQKVNEGELFASIVLDNYVADVDNAKSDLSWTITGNMDLRTNISPDRIADISIPKKWTGSENLTFAVEDPSEASASDDAFFKVEDLAAAPVANDDSYAIAEGGILDVSKQDGVLSNDSDDDGDPLTAILESGPINGTLDLKEDGSFTYTHNGSETTGDVFTYRAFDGVDLSNLATVTITINPVNDAPVLTNIEGTPLAYTEGDGQVQITNSISVTDVDNVNLASATISISANYQSDQDVLAFTNANGITGNWNSGTGVMTLTGSATLSNYQAALRSVRYNNTSSNPNTAPRTVTFRVNDGTDNSNTQNRNITIGASNNPPVLAGIEGTALAYNEGDGLVQITNTITVSDVDNVNLASATISISVNYQSDQDVLAFTNANGITGNWNSGAGVMTLTGSATLSNYQAALRSVRYNNTSSNPNTAPRTVTFRVNDGTDNSNTQNRNITIGASNNSPVLAGIEGTALAYNEGDDLVQITNTITVSDVDNVNLASATISISVNYQSDQDVLAFTNANGITGNWNSGAGVMTLTGSATLSNYQAALRSVRYNNTSSNPNTTPRTVTFRVNDGTDNSNTQNRNITIGASNNPPVLAGIEGTALAYNEGDGLVQITNTITVSDVDNVNLASATISISVNYQSDQDVLAFTNANGITGNWNSGAGVMTLTGSATLSNYQAALRSVRYNNTSSNPNTSPRTVTFRVNDGTDNSNTQNRNITIGASNNSPVLAGIEGTALAYNEGDDLVQITNTITVSDVDNVNLASATISISVNYQSDQDVLAFTNANGITGNWNSGAGVMTLTGSATLSNYQAALRSVRYNNTSSNPNTAPRTVTFRVNDGTDNSNIQNRNITIGASNNPPVLAGIEGTALAYNEGDDLVQITNTITVSDVDNVNLASATISISVNYQSDQDVLAFTNANGITGNWNSGTGVMTLTGSATLSNYQAALRSVRYNNTSSNPNTAPRTVTFRVNDGTDNSNTQNRNITIGASNNSPVLAGIEGTALAYNEGDDLVQITNTITVSDVDNVNLASATISISVNYQSDQDVLAFTNANGITGNWNSGAGVMTLTGSATLSNYQAALRSVRYNNTSSNPNTAPRELTFMVNDGTDISNTQSRIITISATNDSPVLGGIETTPLAYQEGDGPMQITNTITATDVDNTNLSSAIIFISANYQRNQDILSFTNTAEITGNWNTITGILNLSGSSSVVNYQAALRSVRYTNTSSNPNTATRSVTFRVNDGTENSNTQNRNITVTRVGVFSASIVGTGGYCQGALMPITLTIADGKAPFTATLTRSASISNKDTVISGIDASPYIIQVRIAGTYTLKSLTDSNEDEAEISGDPVVLTLNPKPSAVLSGNQSICNDGLSTAPLSLNLSGTAPWTFTIRRGASNDTTYTAISADPFTIQARVIGTSPTTYRMISISDAHCTGDTIGSGTARVIYITSPVAAISGRDTICTYETGKVNIVFSGTPGPWSITYLRNGINPTVVNNITSYSYELVVPGTGTYKLSRVQDAVCTGRVSGTAYVIPYAASTANLSGSATICEHTFTNLSVALTGTSPWKFSYRRNAETPVEEVNILTSPNNMPVKLAGTYTLVEVFDKNCKGTVSGSAIITVTPAPDVTLTGLAPAYNKQSTVWVPITGEPSGGSFSGEGVFPYNNIWYFVPALPPVGTHEIVYSYQTAPGTCFGYDTTLVRVLEADAIIEFPDDRTKYCQNEDPFIITGVNLPNSIGSFTITGGTGLVDNHDNTAIIDPSLLTVNEYTVTYTYYDDGAPLTIESEFEVGKPPVADFIWQSECFTPGQSITFNNTSTSTFGIISGSSWKVYTNTGYDTASTQDITYTFPQSGNHVIELQVQTSYGCTNEVTKEFGLRPTRPLKDETFQEDFETAPLSWLSGISEPDSPNSWMLGNPTEGFSGAKSGDYCWYTYIPTPNAPMEHSWITSPCFDFTGTEKPMLKMDIWRLFNSNRDGANLQATVDSGKTWMLIGQLDDGIYWFNSYNIRGNPGGSSVGWSNIADAGWIEARHSLDMLKGKSAVQFRISYGSDGTAQNNHGIAFDNFWIGDRNRIALLEHFTNASDVLCADADSILNLMIAADSLNIIDLQYHTSFPGPDPFNEQEPYAPGSRVLYYGLSDVPYALLNGGTKIAHRFDYDVRPLEATTMHIEALKDSKFEIIIQKAEIKDNSLNIIVEVTAKENLPARELTVHIVVVEREITSVTGGNGKTTFENVVKAMLPDVAGTTNYKSWVNGEKNTIAPPSWNMEHVYNPDDLWVVAFIQDETTQEVYQAAMDLARIPNGIPDEIKGNRPGSKFMVFPNPASERVFVRFDEPVENNVRIELYNNLGRLVHTILISKGDDEIEIYAADFPDGLYLIRATSNDQVLGIRKMTIAR